MRLLTYIAIITIASSTTVYAATSKAERASLRDISNTIFATIGHSKPVLKDNPIQPAKIELGKQLFFDPRLSRSGIISCNTCHNLGMGGGDNLETSIGHGFAKGPRNSPTVFNAVFNVAQFWDGRAEDLEAQAKGPIQAGVEMNNTPERVEAFLNSIPEYVASFKKAFPENNGAASFDNLAKAIEAFESTLVTPNAPFDRFLDGDLNALSDKQVNGLNLFIKKGCVTCHIGVNLGGQEYFAFGLIEKPAAAVRPDNDTGRFVITNTEADKYLFRAAPLRNVAITAPYFHSGAIWSLQQAVQVMGQVQLGQEITDQEANDIAVFLESLTGDMPKIDYPQLPRSTATTPKPEL